MNRMMLAIFFLSVCYRISHRLLSYGSVSSTDILGICTCLPSRVRFMLECRPFALIAFLQGQFLALSVLNCLFGVLYLL